MILSLGCYLDETIIKVWNMHPTINIIILLGFLLFSLSLNIIIPKQYSDIKNIVQLTNELIISDIFF